MQIVFPLIHVPSGSPLRNGPKCSINMSNITNYYTSLGNKWPNDRSLCAEIINGVIDIRGLVMTDNADYRLIYLDNPAEAILKSHLLGAIECFKYIINNGHKYYYDIRKDPQRYAQFNSNNRLKYIYADVHVILQLLYIDSREIDDFIIYYFSLFPKVKNDKQLAYFIIGKMIMICKDVVIGTGIRIYNRVFHVLQKSGIVMDYIFYQYIFHYLESGLFRYNAITLLFIQSAINFGIKLKSEQIIMLSNLSRAIVQSKTLVFYNYDDAIVFIYKTMEHLYKNHQESDTKSIIEIVEGIQRVINSQVTEYTSIGSLPLQLLAPVISAELANHNNMLFTFDELLGVLVIVMNDILDNNMCNITCNSDIVKMDIHNITTSINQRFTTNYNDIVYNKVKKCATQLSSISFNIEMDWDKNCYLYKQLDRQKIKNYDEWFTEDRRISFLANKIKLEHIIESEIAKTGNTIQNNNMISLIDIIAKYC